MTVVGLFDEGMKGKFKESMEIFKKLNKFSVSVFTIEDRGQLPVPGLTYGER